MTALCDRRIPDCASAWSTCGKLSPPSANPPILRKSRREWPSQNRPLEVLEMVSMRGGGAVLGESGCSCVSNLFHREN